MSKNNNSEDTAPAVKTKRKLRILACPSNHGGCA